jgi:2,3-bisphosphoglycerate-dependent phosphoglycerate mutase
MTRLVLIRHGESVSTVERRIGGVRTCGGLSPLGRKQAEALAARLARTGEIQADVLVSSTIRRAIETAEIIAPALGELPIEQIADLGEHEPGPECDGMTFDAFVERFGQPDWSGDPYLVGFPGGESLAAFKHRAATALHLLMQRYEGSTVVVSCHAGVVDAGLRSFLNVSMAGVFELSTTNTSITEFLHNSPRWRLLRYNDAAHLEGLPHDTPRE